MAWWDFTNTNFLFLFIIGVIALLSLVFFIVSFLIDRKACKNHKAQIERASNTTRIFVINFREDKVVYFDRYNVDKKVSTNLVGFYSCFHENDVEKVKDWLYSICVTRNNAEDFIEADVVNNKGRDNYFSLLQLLKYDQTTNVVHIESHIMKYITPNNTAIKSKHGVNYGIVDRVAMAELINNQKAAKGFTYAIRFFYIKPLVNASHKYETYVAMSMKDVIYPYANDPHRIRQIIDSNTNQLLLFDLNITSTTAALQLANSIQNDIKKAISLSSYNDSISFAIGVVSNAEFYQDFDNAIDSVEQACIYAQQNNLYTYLYSRTNSRHVVTTKKLENQINDLFKQNTVRYLYRPIIDASKESVVGFFEYVKAYDLPFSDFYEMQKYAIKIDKSKELFSLVAKNVISRFAYQASSISDRLFFSTSLFDIEYADVVIKQIKGYENVKLVLTFDQEEIYENTDDSKKINEDLNNLRNQGYRLALFIRDEDLIIDPLTYLNFDYFIVGASMVGELKRSTRSRLSVLTLVEQLLKYHKPIIATDLGSSQAIEIIVKSGIYLLSSESIASSSEMLLPVDKKKLARLRAHYEKYN